MKRSVKMRILAGISMMAVTACWSGTSVYAADEQASGDTDYLTNHTVSQTSGNIAGDLDSYNHPDRNLEIKWTDDSRGNKAPVCDGTVTAKNITIDSNFPTKANFNWMDKGVISQSDVGSHLTASGDINIMSYDDGVYTDGNGKVTIDGFKNLTINSIGTGEGEEFYDKDDDKTYVRNGQAFGIVDNGEGVTIQGDKGSTVTVISHASEMGHAVIGNSILSAFETPMGKHITINADNIKIQSDGVAIQAYRGTNDDGKFHVNLNASNIDITGAVGAMGGKISINPHTDGTIKIHSAKEDGGISVTNFAALTINEAAKGLVQIKGGINTGYEATTLINMTGDGSYLEADDRHTDYDPDGYGTKNAVQVGPDGKVTLNLSGNDSYIKGDTLTEGGDDNFKNGGILEINASGDNFSMGRTYKGTGFTDEQLIEAIEQGQTDIHVSGNNSTITGSALAYHAGKIDLDMSGDHATFNGDLMTKWQGIGVASVDDDQSKITANFSGANAAMTGNINAQTSNSTVTANFSGTNGKLTGNVKSLNSEFLLNPDQVNGNVANLNMTGAHTVQVGDLIATGNNTVNANYTGTDSSLIGNADNKGLMNLTFDNQSQMTGDMTNDTFTYNNKKTFDGQLKANFNNGSRWTGDLKNISGTTNVSLNNSSHWNGDLSSAAGTTTVNLNNSSVWNGSSTGNGDINLAGNSVWNLTKDSTVQSVNPDGSSVISLSGAAKKLDTQKLGGTGGTFLMDLSYHNNDINTYRNGGGDFVVAHGGNGSAYNVSLTNNSSVNGMTDGSKLYFASTAADSSTFRMNQAVQVENYKKIYNKNLMVKKETENSDSDFKGYDDWFLTPDSSKGNGGNTINPNGIVPGSAANAALALWRDDDTLLKRLGELRYQQQDEGVWARMVNKHLERDGHHAFHGNYKTLQVGYDKKKTTESDGNWYYGGAISHLWGNTGYTDGYGSEKSTDLSLYATNIRPHGHYLDLIAKVGRIDSDYNTSYRDHGKFENWGTSIGAEYGRKNNLNGGWSIEPQAQLTYHYLWGDDYTTSNGAKVSQDNADSLVGRLGFVLGKDFNVGTPNVGRVYLKASVLHDFLGSTGSSITDDITYHDDDDLGDTWYVAGIGTNIHFGKDNQFYFDAERNFHADVSMKYRFNAGFRFGF